MAAKKKKSVKASRKSKPAKAARGKTKARKAAPKRAAPPKAKPRKAKPAPAKAATVKAKAKKAKVKKAARKPAAEFGEGNYKASRRFRAKEERFVKTNRAKIPALGKAAEAALEGPEGDALRAAEAEAAHHAHGQDKQ
ncbi:MAG TPA: hypothetical protein VGB91_04525 [Rhizomicrobium sp.]